MTTPKNASKSGEYSFTAGKGLNKKKTSSVFFSYFDFNAF